MKTYSVLILAILTQATGNVFLSKGMKHIGSLSQMGDGSLLLPLAQAAGNPTIWLGTALMIIFFLLFTAALSWADLSLVLPAISIEVVVNVAFADYFLNESVSLVRWLGTMIICVGVIFVLRSGKEGTRPGQEGEGNLEGRGR